MRLYVWYYGTKYKDIYVKIVFYIDIYYETICMVLKYKDIYVKIVFYIDIYYETICMVLKY